MKFVKLCKNSKLPIKDEKYSKKTYNSDDINTSIYNIGIHAGASNVIIIDVDIKDDGLNEWNEYVKINGEPQTVCQRSANGGLHYFFNYKSLTYNDKEIELINTLKNKSKYRSKGIDIRKDNGYVVCEPSTIDDKKYEFIRHYNKYPVSNIPLSLLEWILEFEKKEFILNDVKVIVKNEKLKNLFMTMIQIGSK